MYGSFLLKWKRHMDSEVSTGAGVQSRSSMKYVAGIGIIVIGSIIILSVLKKKKLEDYE